MLKGYKFSKESKEKMRLSHLGKIHNGSFKKGHLVSIKIRKKISKANKGKIPWNKGKKLNYKRSVSDEVKKIMSEKMKGNKNGRFNKGKIVSLETRIKQSNSQKGRICSKITKQKLSDKLKGKMPKNLQNQQYGNVKNGWYLIGETKMYFRSRWEANYALYLNWLKKIGEIKDWKYEEDVFIFEKIKFGTRSYRPDFKIFNNDGSIHYDEVKGYMDASSKTKINRMRIYYPKIKLNIIDEKAYNSIKNKVGGMLKFY